MAYSHHKCVVTRPCCDVIRSFGCGARDNHSRSKSKHQHKPRLDKRVRVSVCDLCVSVLCPWTLSRSLCSFLHALRKTDFCAFTLTRALCVVWTTPSLSRSLSRCYSLLLCLCVTVCVHRSGHFSRTTTTSNRDSTRRHRRSVLRLCRCVHVTLLSRSSRFEQFV